MGGNSLEMVGGEGAYFSEMTEFVVQISFVRSLENVLKDLVDP